MLTYKPTAKLSTGLKSCLNVSRLNKSILKDTSDAFPFTVKTSKCLQMNLKSWAAFQTAEVTTLYYLKKHSPSLIMSEIDRLLAPQPHLCLSETQLCSELSPLWQCQVLGWLESPLQDCQLIARVDGPGLAHLLGLAIDHPNLHVWLLFHCEGEKEKSWLHIV